MKRYAVYYGSVMARDCKSGTEAIYQKWADAQAYADEMNRSVGTDKYFVVSVSVNPVKEKKK